MCSYHCVFIGCNTDGTIAADVESDAIEMDLSAKGFYGVDPADISSSLYENFELYDAARVFAEPVDTAERPNDFRAMSNLTPITVGMEQYTIRI